MTDYKKARDQAAERWDQQLRIIAYPAGQDGLGLLRYVVDLNNARLYLSRAVEEAFMAGANWGLQRRSEAMTIYVDHVGGDTSGDEVRDDSI